MIKPMDDLEQAIQNLTARMTVSEYELLVLIREFDERGGWLRWGFTRFPDVRTRTSSTPITSDTGVTAARPVSRT